MKPLKCFMSIFLIFIFAKYFGAPFVKEYLKETVIFVEREGPLYNPESHQPTIKVWSPVLKGEGYKKSVKCLNSTLASGDLVNCLYNNSKISKENLKLEVQNSKYDWHVLDSHLLKPSYGLIFHGLKFGINSSFDFSFPIRFETAKNNSLFLAVYDSQFFVEDHFKPKQFGVENLLVPPQGI